MNSASTATAKWDALAETWHDAGPPASPSVQDLRVYSRFLKEALKASGGSHRILMLGCTPSLRRIIGRLAIPLTCVDISTKMIAKTTALVRATRRREKLVNQNWLELNLGGTRFSAVVGDKFLDNVPYALWPDLKARLLAHLAPGGHVITRVAPQDPSLLSLTFNQLLDRWTALYEGRSVSAREAASGLWEQALGASSDSVPGRQSIAVFRTEMVALDEQANDLTEGKRAILEEFKALFSSSLAYEWSSYTLGNVIDALGEELVLVGIARANDYSAGRRQPVLMFRADTIRQHVGRTSRALI